VTENKLFPVPKDWTPNSGLDEKRYRELYERSIKHNDDFWAEQAKRLTWTKPWTKVKQTSFVKPVSIAWFLEAELNVSYNCLDRHLEKNGNTVAFHWVPEDVAQKPLAITYRSLYESVCQWSGLLKECGVKKGDRVTIYLPMIPEAVYAMLACARIGAPHSVIFAGFSPDSIADRLKDCESEIVITADQGLRGGKALDLKANVDRAIEISGYGKKVIVVRRTGARIDWKEGRDVWAHEHLPSMPTTFPAEPMSSEHPLFILYTSGSTNKPKGILHTSGGYLTYASMTHEMVFDYKRGDVYWCAADIGWVTGHSYIVYGPLANGATSVLYEGLPTYPTTSRIWEIVDQFSVSTLYTAPTLIRALMAQGDQHVAKTSRRSLRVLGSVGEPINPEAWLWYHRVAGNSRCPIVDTWWQTETGGIAITPLPGATALKPGSATRAFFGIEPVLLDEKGKPIEGEGKGSLCLKSSWPGQMRSVYGDHDRVFKTYFEQFPGYYFSGDECRRDADGYYWITGRVDDVLNVSGHRLGTAEVESALVAHPSVSESAVVGFPHDLKGQGIYAFVTLRVGVTATDALKNELKETVKKQIGGLARPDVIQWAPALPKTRSGKIMRRILRKIASGDLETIGDTSTLADPEVVKQLIANREK
jgi:acetyl-CoA synthetase